MANLPAGGDDGPTEVTDGYFERELTLSRAAVADFLEALAEQVAEGDELAIESEAWRVPFAFDEPIEIEVEFAGGSRDTLELEFEFDERMETESLDVR